jgi:hypothetical protein
MIAPAHEEERSPLVVETDRRPGDGGAIEPSVADRIMRVAEEKADADHHRLPQFFLKRFVGRSKRVEVVDPTTGAAQLLLPKEAFAEAGYYTARLGEQMEPMALVEVLYETIEDAAAKPIRLLAKGASPADLSVDERAKIAEFLSTQLTRGESFKQTTGEFVDEISKTMLRMQATHAGNSWPAFLKSLGEPEDLMTADEFVEAVDKDRFKVVPSPEQLLNLRLVAVEQMAEVFMSFSWHCVRFQQPCLFTSEEPVNYWREPSPGSEFLGIGAETTDEVRIALSPRLAVVLTHPRWGFADGQVAGGRAEAALLNFGTLIFHPGFPVVRSPDVRHHPLPRTMFQDSRVMLPFLGGPVVRG